MDTEHLEIEEDRAYVARRIVGTNLDNHEAWMRFWSENTVQLDGTFTTNELTLLVDIMRSLPSVNVKIENDQTESVILREALQKIISLKGSEENEWDCVDRVVPEMAAIAREALFVVEK